MSEQVWMLPADLDPEEFDFSNPEVVEAIEVLHKEQKYNSALYTFLGEAYPWQKTAMNLSKDCKVVGMLIGNQCGKTTTAMAIVAMHLTGIYPHWYVGKRFTKPPVVCVAGENANHNRMSLQKILFGTDNRQMADDMGTGMIPKELIVEGSVSGDRGTSVKTCKVMHSSGGNSSLEFRAYSDGRAAIQGFPADVICVDEQPDEDFWSEALVRTTATDGLVICSFTPLKGYDGLVGTLHDLPATEEFEGVRVKKDAPWAMVNAGWLDSPHITEEQIHNLSLGLNASQLQARKYGTPYLGEGRVFDIELDKCLYEKVGTNIQKRWLYLSAIDFGWTRDPMAIVHSAYDEDEDVIYVTKCYKGHVNSYEELAHQIRVVDTKCSVAWPRDGNNTAGGNFKGGETHASTLIDLGVNLLPKCFSNPRGVDGKKTNFIEPGLVEINSRLAEGRLKISEDCVELISEMDKYAYVDGKIAPKQDDHLIDALRYNVMSQIQFLGDRGDGAVEYDNVEDDFHYSVI